jgi:hypothetical protein
MKLGFSGQTFKQFSDFKFHENPSSGSWVNPCGRTDGRTDMVELIVAFRNFTKTPKNRCVTHGRLFLSSGLVHSSHLYSPCESYFSCYRLIYPVFQYYNFPISLSGYNFEFSHSELSHKEHYYLPRFPELTFSFMAFILPTAVYRNAGVHKSQAPGRPGD